MGYARSPRSGATDRVTAGPRADLSQRSPRPSPLAATALEQGLLQGYRHVDDTLPVVRGRIREAEQIRRRFGRLLPLEVRYDDFTVDIAENQLLLAAALRLLRLPGLSRQTRTAAAVAPPAGGRDAVGRGAPLPRGSRHGSTPATSRRSGWPS